MSYLTAAVLALFVAYLGSWYAGMLEGNMALFLFVATLVTGVYWLAEKFLFLPKRRAAAMRYEQQLAQQRAEQGSAEQPAPAPAQEDSVKTKLLSQPWWLDWTAGLFPVIAVVFMLRSFAFEPFKIPSGSMIPTLMVGDLILVNKWVWGLRLPVVNTKITAGSAVQRGDVMVFHYPPKPSMDYIKRVVGLPGDTVSYLDKKLTINGKEIDKNAVEDFLGERESIDYSNGQIVGSVAHFKQYQEQLGTHKHRILNDPERPAAISVASYFPQHENCNYSQEGVTCKVPAGHYFVMGDNRDNSEDSRYWGFVPDENIVGKAVFVWMNFGDLKRIGSIQ